MEIQSKQIQWFPGHMAKTKRLIRESLSLVDIVIEILDARIPYSSHNPDIEKLASGKPRLILLNKASLASPDVSGWWRNYYKTQNIRCIFTDCNTGEGLNEIMPAVREILSEKLARYSERGMTGRTLKALVVGIPNSGKSTFINRMAGSVKAKAENRPGVTRDKQWVPTKHGIDLLDTPGVLWPKF
ncbi:MAG: ribosome biogenesis GTPase YlqF, partial [Clostridia bacterium]|nr:ribosome biogenesis GTPase YlqF [Clostridia bacterium]